MTTNTNRRSMDAAKMEEREALALDFFLFQAENDVFFRVCESEGETVDAAAIRRLYLAELASGKRPYTPRSLQPLEIVTTLQNMTEPVTR